MFELICIFIAFGVLNFIGASFFMCLSAYSRGPSFDYYDREKAQLPPWAIDKNPNMLPRWLLSYLSRRAGRLREHPGREIHCALIPYRDVDQPFKGVSRLRIENQVGKILQIPPFRP